MPFGHNCEYPNFEACVRDNQGLDNPEGYCAVLMRETESKCANNTCEGAMSRRITLAKVRLLERLADIHPEVANVIRTTKLPWYRITTNQMPGEEDFADESAASMEEGQDDETNIFIYDEIGGSFGVDANQFVADLQKITTSTINLRINSPGGSAKDAIAIYNSLILHPARVVTYVDSIAASAASIIAMAGDKIIMMTGSQMMVHDAMVEERGNAAQLRDLADWVDHQSDNVASIYAERTGKTRRYWRAKMLAETWALADEAVQLRLADEVFIRSTNDPEPINPQKGKKDEVPPDDEPMEDDVESYNHIQHRLTNRGFKYCGRQAAPDPLVNIPVDDAECPADTAVPHRLIEQLTRFGTTPQHASAVNTTLRERRSAMLDMLTEIDDNK